MFEVGLLICLDHLNNPMPGREFSNAFFITNDIFMSMGIFYLTVHPSLLHSFHLPSPKAEDTFSQGD